jgi:hypothetical protein
MGEPRQKKLATHAHGADIGRPPPRQTVLRRENASRACLPGDCVSRLRGLSSSIPILAFRRLTDFEGAFAVHPTPVAALGTYSERYVCLSRKMFDFNSQAEVSPSS